MGNESVKSLAKILVGKLPSETNNPIAIRRTARANFSKGKVASGFARNTGTGSAKAGDIERTAITAERLAGVGRDSETNTTGFKEQNRAAHEAAQERRRQERERVDAAKERNGQGQDENTPEDELAYQAELESERERIAEGQHSSNSRGKTKPTGLMAVNAEYRRRKGLS